MQTSTNAIEQLFLDDITATTIKSIYTKSYSDVYLTFVGSNTPDWNVKIYQGKKEGIEFSADGTNLTAASATNPITTQYCINTSSNAGVDGATGLTVNNTTPVRLRINDFYNGQIAVVATRTGGNLTVYLEAVNRSLNGV